MLKKMFDRESKATQRETERAVNQRVTKTRREATGGMMKSIRGDKKKNPAKDSSAKANTAGEEIIEEEFDEEEFDEEEFDEEEVIEEE